MPAPIAHAAMGYLIYKAFRPHMSDGAHPKAGPVPLLLAAAVGLSLAPDLDAIPSVLFNDFARFHNNLTHSISAGLAAAGISLLIGGVARPKAVKWTLLVLVSYQAHLLMDLFTYDTRGLMLLWPFSVERFKGSFVLFYGVRWSDGVVSAKHLITITSEAGLALLAFVSAKLAERIKMPSGG